MTGLERAKLERNGIPPQPASVPPVQTFEELPPQPVMAERPAEKLSEKPKAVVAPAKPAAPEKNALTSNTAHLHVGPGVTLKGEIFGCDTLRVEGSVEGNAAARQLIVCAGGSFNGTVEIEEGDIEGRFEGTLNVAGRLFLRATGRVCGTLSYGQIEVERGGEILGDIAVRGTAAVRKAAPPAPAPAARPAAPASATAAEPPKKPSLLVR